MSVVIELATDHERTALAPDGGGYFAGDVPAVVGSRYRFLLDDGRLYADPASRFQPEGPHGPSVVVDPATFIWSDTDWPGLQPRGLVVYEMHVGTFTAEGTWAAATRELPSLVALGITAIEMMPIADFPGQFGWGYDGVNFFAPTRLYGTPDDLRAFVNRAHQLGLGVVLDVVYNHAGPDGCFLDRFAAPYFSETETEWGRGFNFDGPESGPVREFFETNARYWIEEFHFDGLRLDATQQIFDRSNPRIVRTVAESARQAAGARPVWIVAENEPQDSALVRPASQAGDGLDAIWNDDFHHTAMVAATGEREAYYLDYLGSPQEFISCAMHGFLYQGQWYRWQQQRRGTPTDGIAPWQFVAFLQNHDQVANSTTGERLHARARAGVYRALTALLLLGPWTPMLFQGQEFAASTPFLFFADHKPPLSEAVAAGRRTFLSQFPSTREAAQRGDLDAPHSVHTFARCRLDHGERERHRAIWQMHRTLLELRRADPVISAQAPGGVAGTVLGPGACVLRFSASAARASPDVRDRLLVVNLGDALEFDVIPYPLLAAAGEPWNVLWSTEDVAWGSSSSDALACRTDWKIPAESAWLLA